MWFAALLDVWPLAGRVWLWCVCGLAPGSGAGCARYKAIIRGAGARSLFPICALRAYAVRALSSYIL